MPLLSPPPLKASVCRGIDMMLVWYSLNLAHEARMVEDAVRAAIDTGLRTKDMGGSTGTAEAGDAIVAELVQILKA